MPDIYLPEPEQSEYNIPKAALIDMLVRYDLPERHVTALGEFIDNALGEASGNAESVTIEFAPDRIVITDDGAGIANLNALSTLGDSYSRLNTKDIGQFGFGAKVGALYLAWDMEIETVHEGLYHSYRVDWEQVRNSGHWARKYRGEGIPAHSALGGIQKGTRITLRRRHADRVWQGQALAEHLAHIYRPALIAGRRITVAQGRGTTKRIWDLSKSLGVLQHDSRIEARGDVHGKTFRLRAGRSRNLSTRLNGVHIAFGHRFIVTEHALITRHIPAQLYAEVMLSHEWKDSLSATKSSMSTNRDALLREIERLLTPLIDELESEAVEIEIKGFVLEIAQDAEKLIDAASEAAGNFGTGLQGERGRGNGGGRSPQPGHGNPLPSAKGRGDHDRTEDALRNKKTGITVALASLGQRVTKVSIATSGARVELNKDLLYIRLVKKDKAGILGTIFHALLDECVRDETQAKVLPAFKLYRERGEAAFEAKEHVLFDLLKLHEPSMRQ